MASSSVVSPKKLNSQICNPEILDVKWKAKCSRYSHQSGNESQLPNHDSAAKLPAEKTSMAEKLTKPNEVLFEHPSVKMKDLKVYFRLPNLKRNDPPVVVDKVGTGNPNSHASDEVVAAALADKRAEGDVKSYNFRARKPVRDPNGDAGAQNTSAPVMQPNKIPERSRAKLARGCQNKTPKQPMMGISLTLTKEEIEKDILIMTGRKPLRRPKRRPRSLQKQLDIATPGTSLNGLSAETYKADY